MNTPTSTRPRAYRFGPFEADLLKCELRKEGLRIRLERKPWQLLVALLERRGETVTRSELEKRLWPEGLFVDFEHGINVAVKKLRSALLDSVDDPRYILTLPGEGYRFIAQAEEVATPSRDEALPTIAPRDSAAQAATLAERFAGLPAGSSILLPDAGRQKVETLSLAAVLVILVFAAGFGLYWPRVRHLAVAGAGMTITRIIPDEETHVSAGTSISPDGKYVAYQIDRDGKRTIWVRQLATGSAIAVAEVPANVRGTTTFSRDGNFLYYHRGLEIFRVPTLGGEARKVTDRVNGSVCFSPDGGLMAYVRNLTEDRVAMYVADADGSNEHMLVERQRPASWFMFACSWSPDGRRIGIGGGTTVGQDAYNTILAVDAASGTTAQLSERQWNFVGGVNWLADNTGIVFEASERGEPSQLYELSLADGSVRRITTDLNSGYGWWTTVVADDGETAVAVRQVTKAHLWTVPGGDPSGGQQLKAGTGTDGFGGVTSIPDGRVLFSSIATGSYALWILDPSGSTSPRRITRDEFTAQFPTVTPDGRFVVFVGKTGSRYVVYRAALDGSDVKIVSSGNTAGNPVATPDSRSVFFYTAKGLWKSNLETGEEKRLSERRIEPFGITSDGRLLGAFYVSSPGADWQVAMVSAETGDIVRTLPMIPIVNNAPVPRLTPSGDGIAYVDMREGAENIVVRPLDGGEARQLTRFTGEHIFSFDWMPGGGLVVARGSRVGDAVLIRNLR
jgi:Tol biopolymer transport system component/DNA-binding winged helix-turn-helix (wHTH) protein